MKYRTFINFICILSLSLIIGSCSKTNEDNIIGKWKIEHEDKFESTGSINNIYIYTEYFKGGSIAETSATTLDNVLITYKERNGTYKFQDKGTILQNIDGKDYILHVSFPNNNTLLLIQQNGDRYAEYIRTNEWIKIKK